LGERSDENNIISECVILVGLSSSSIAYASKNFKCSVIDSYTLGESGKIDQSSNSAIKARGKEFIVNRQTGQITGGGFTNTMSGIMCKNPNLIFQSINSNTI
jgi:hypothetical protein